MHNPYNMLNLYTRILQTQNIGYLLVDGNLNILTENLLVNYWVMGQSEQLVGQRLIAVFPELLELEEQSHRLSEALSDSLVIDNIQRSSPDGQQHYLKATIQGYTAQEAYLLVIFTDVTQQVKLAQQLQHEREKVQTLSLAIEDTESKRQQSNNKIEPQTSNQNTRSSQAKTQPEEQMQQLQILDAFPDLILRVSKDGIFLDFKASEETDLYMSPAEFMGKSVMDVMPGSIAQQTMQSIELTLSTGNTQRLEYQLPMLDAVHDYEARTSIIDDDEVLIIVRDITQRKQAEKEIHQYIERLQILHKIDKSILKAKSSEAIVQKALQKIRRLVPMCSKAIVTVFNFDLDEAQIFAVSSKDKTQFDLGQRLSLTEYGYIENLKKGTSFATDDLSTVTVPSSIHRKLLKEGIQSTIQTPLVSQQQLIGELILGADYPRAFSFKFTEIANEVADRIAITIQNTRLYDELDQRIKELATLNLIGQTIASTLDLSEILPSITDHVSRLLSVTAASVVLLDKSKNDLWFATATGEGADFIKDKRLARNHGIVGWVIENGEATLVADTAKDTRFYASFDEKSGKTTRSVLCVPLQAKGRTIGAIEAINKEIGTFNEKDLNILSAIAASAATAIENARLYQQAQQEIIERKQAERELDLFFTLSLDMLCIMNLDGYIRRSSPAFKKTLGWSSDELLSKSFFEITHPDDIEATLAERDQLAQGIPTDYFEVRSRHKNGSYRWLAWSVQPGADGILYGVARDVTKQKQTEALLRSAVRKNSQLAAAIENAPIGVSITDPNQPDHPIVFINPAFTEITGYTEKEVVGKNSRYLYGNNIDREAINEIQQAIIEQRTYSCVLLNHRKDGSPFWNELTISPVFDNEGKLSNFVELQVDVTERKEAQESLVKERALLAERVEERTIELKKANIELAQAARMKDEFLANMSHELRTPLNAILSMSEILKMETYGSLNEEQQNTLKYIQDGGRHLLALINEILDLSKIEAGQLQLDTRMVNIDEICQSSLLFIKQMALKKQIKVVSTFDSTIDTIEVDERRLKQVLVNLLSNAAKFTPIKGKIGLEVEKDTVNDLVNFIVWDTGIGIAKEDQKSLFDPFVQIDSSLSREYEGTGLGLALVQRLTKMHGGQVTVESTLGKGSRFTVSLPIRGYYETELMTKIDPNSTKEQTLPFDLSSEQDKFAETESYLILVVDDNEASRIALTDLLRHKNYQVIVAEGGAEAIKRAKQERPDIIIMDVQMPEMDGLEATRQIRADITTQNIPIITLTALAMPGDKERCLEAGANDYMSKPINMRKLLEIIKIQLSQVTEASI